MNQIKHTAFSCLLLAASGLLLAAATHTGATAQSRDVTVSYAPGSDFNMTTTPVGVAGNATVGYVQVEQPSGSPLTFKITYLDKDMKLKKREVVKMDFKYDYFTQTFYVKELGGKFYLFYSLCSDEAKSDKLCARELDMTANVLKPEVITVVDGGSLDKAPGKWYVDISPDGSKMLVSYLVKKESFRDAINHLGDGMYVFDAAMKEQWHREFRHEYTEGEEAPGSLVLTNKGVCYLMTQFKDEESGVGTAVYRFADGTAAPGKLVVDLGGRTNVQAMLSSDKNDEPVIVGLYSNKTRGKKAFNAQKYGSFDGKAPSAAGMYFMPVSAGGKLAAGAVQYNPIPLEVHSLYVRSRDTKDLVKDEEKGTRELPYLQLISVVPRTDGSWDVVSTIQYSFTTDYTSWGAGSMTTHSGVSRDVVNNIYVARLAPDGSVKWVNKIRAGQAFKEAKLKYFQRVIGENYNTGSGIAIVQSPTAVYVVLNTNPKNFELGNDEATEVLGNPKAGKVVAFKIDDAGAITRQQIMDCKTSEKYPLLSEFVPTGNSSAILGRVRGDGDKVQLMRLMVN